MMQCRSTYELVLSDISVLAVKLIDNFELLQKCKDKFLGVLRPIWVLGL